MIVRRKQTDWLASTCSFEPMQIEARDNDLLISKGFHSVQGRWCIDQGATTKEEPMCVESADEIQERFRDHPAHPLSYVR